MQLTVAWVLIFSFAALSLSALELEPIFPLQVSQFSTWQLQGYAGSLGDRIRLIGGEVDKVGAITGLPPSQLEKYLEVSLEFSVHSNNQQPGTELIVWLTSTPFEIGDLHGGPNNFEGIAVVLNSAESTLSLYSNNGGEQKTFSNPIATCNYHFKKGFSSERSQLYIIFERDLNSFNIFTSENRKNNWEKCIISQQTAIPAYFYSSVSCKSSTKSVDFCDLFNFYILSNQRFDVDEESFQRPSMSIITPLIANEEIAHDLLDLDDEDVANEIRELTIWFSNQVDSLKYTVGNQIVELNIGLDQLSQHSSKLINQLDLIKKSNEVITKEIEESSKFFDALLKSDKDVPELKFVHDTISSLEKSTLSFSESILSVHQSINRRKSSKIKEKHKFENTLKQVTDYLIVTIFALVILGAAIFAYRYFASNQKSTPRSPSWAANL